MTEEAASISTKCATSSKWATMSVAAVSTSGAPNENNGVCDETKLDATTLVAGSESERTGDGGGLS
jgi:hypothetical protein